MADDIHKARGQRAESAVKELLRKRGWYDALPFAIGIAQQEEFRSRMEAGKRAARAEEHRTTLDIFDDFGAPTNGEPK